MIAPSYDKIAWAAVKRYDSALELQWNNRVNRWELWRQGPNREVLIVRLENADGSFRKLDNRLLSYLISCDGWTKHNGDATAIHKELLEHERKEQAKKDRTLYDRLDEVSKSQYARRILAGV